jgi:hypothetical protein
MLAPRDDQPQQEKPPISEAKADAEFAEVIVQQSPRRERCLECGRDVTNWERVFSCPDCGSVFCSSLCIREHHDHAHGARRRPRSSPEPDPDRQTREPDYAGMVVGIVFGVIFFVVLLVAIIVALTSTTSRW